MRAAQTGAGAPPDGADAIAAADELLAAMSAIRRAARQRGGRPAEFASLTTAQLELIRVLRRRPGLSVAEAAQELRLASNTVSTLVRELADAGMLERRIDKDDRRVARLDLAPDIRRKLERWRDERVVALASAIDGLPSEDRRLLLAALPLLGSLADGLVQPQAPR
jgi:DNA-binding MarR family transcriptional regulator